VLVLAAIACGLYIYWPVLSGNLRAARVAEWLEAQVYETRSPQRLNDGDRVPSPDGSVYLAYRRGVTEEWERFEVYRSGDDRPLGRFQRRAVLFWGWSEDSSGFYVSVVLPPGPGSGTWWSGGPGRLREVVVPRRRL